MKKELENLIQELTGKWEEARSLQNRDCGKRTSYERSFDTVNGNFPWDNSSLVMLCNFVASDGYEEWGSIVGLSKDGKLMWEYQSHCSCNDFGDSNSAEELKHEHILEKKSFELQSVPIDYQEKIEDSIKKILAAI